MLEPLCSYQGGKARLASRIHDEIGDLKRFNWIYDMCCGSGAFAIEAINRGYDPEWITMVDEGPWGLVWEAVGDGSFCLNTFKRWCNSIPSDPKLICEWMKHLSRCPVDSDAPYVFLLLQAASFGGKALWIENWRWKNCSFRSYWEPTATSNRRSPVNPMMPMPTTLYDRTARVCDKMFGVTGVYWGAENVEINFNSLVYIDPPYDGTSQYGHTIDLNKVYQNAKGKGYCYVSEGRPLGDQSVCLSEGRAKGGMSGKRSKAHAEWLTLVV